MDVKDRTVLREPAEVRFAGELAALAAADKHPRPRGWKLSPRAVRTFLLGSDGVKVGKGKAARPISQKFYGDDMLVDRCCTVRSPPARRSDSRMPSRYRPVWQLVD